MTPWIVQHWTPILHNTNKHVTRYSSISSQGHNKELPSVRSMHYIVLLIAKPYARLLDDVLFRSADEPQVFWVIP